jgi:hypothetical protein
VGQSGANLTRSADRRVGRWLLVGAAAVALCSGVPFAGSPNDGSRLATVEALVDHHTFAIDDSIFVKPPPATSPREQLPYHPEWDPLPEIGTVDKLRIDGRYYSDKPPVAALLMAGLYQVLQWTTGLRARDRADLFCYAMTVGSSGLAYVLSVWGTYRLGRVLRLGRRPALGLALSLGLATVAGVYVRQVNNHILQLAVAVLLFWQLARLVRAPAAAWTAGALASVGTLAGLGYAVEQASGALLLAGTVALVAWYRRGWCAAAWTACAALPWVLLHHAVVWSFAHTLRPIGAVPAFFDYPGSEFHAGNLTGLWNHGGLGACADYAWRLLLGERGFVPTNLPLLLALPAQLLLLGRARPERPLLVLGALWSAGTWLVYAALSTNYSGVCCSIRWFVPLLAPAYLALAVLLRDHPACGLDLLALSAWGAVLVALMWFAGPWGFAPGIEDAVFWVVLSGAFVTWAAVQLWGRRLSARLS